MGRVSQGHELLHVLHHHRHQNPPGCCADVCVFHLRRHMCACVFCIYPLLSCPSVCQSCASADCIITLMEAITSRCRTVFGFFVHVRRLEFGGCISPPGRHRTFYSVHRHRHNVGNAAASARTRSKTRATFFSQPDKRFDPTDRKADRK